MNMREIKFRAWIGESWVYSESISKDNDVWRILNHEDDNWWACLEPQQYTGLKDKNDKEIYEGDILSDDNYSNVDGSVVFDEEKGYYEIAKFNYEPLHESLKDYDFEVVGNIYENPDLLEASK